MKTARLAPNIVSKLPSKPVGVVIKSDFHQSLCSCPLLLFSRALGLAAIYYASHKAAVNRQSGRECTPWELYNILTKLKWKLTGWVAWPHLA